MAGSSFRFELAPVLQLRNQAVELAQAELGRRIDARKEAEAAVRDATEALNASLDGAAAGPRTVHQLGGAAAHREVRARTLAEAIQTLDRRAAAAAAAKRALGTALRQREALVTLRTEAADAHRVEATRSDAARLDDIATGRVASARHAAAHHATPSSR